jgi:hypothetical protein
MISTQITISFLEFGKIKKYLNLCQNGKGTMVVTLDRVDK